MGYSQLTLAKHRLPFQGCAFLVSWKPYCPTISHRNISFLSLPLSIFVKASDMYHGYMLLTLGKVQNCQPLGRGSLVWSYLAKLRKLLLFLDNDAVSRTQTQFHLPAVIVCASTSDGYFTELSINKLWPILENKSWTRHRLFPMNKMGSKELFQLGEVSHQCKDHWNMPSNYLTRHQPYIFNT